RDSSFFLCPQFEHLFEEGFLVAVSNPRKEPRWKGYGLGIDVFSYGLYGHGGSTIGFTSECFFSPESKLGFVRLASVGAVLMAQESDWNDLDSSTDAIRDLVMIHVGMLPQFSALEMIPLAGVAIVDFIVLRRVQIRYSRSRRQKSPEIAIL
ncbi:MAG: hypothetical protein P1Q69_08225, partial [Candidatus Thorarchaeota archaeon]|nr:hypothetical protein [Candidatus Thorarchaeota archaeon]